MEYEGVTVNSALQFDQNAQALSERMFEQQISTLTKPFFNALLLVQNLANSFLQFMRLMKLIVGPLTEVLISTLYTSFNHLPTPREDDIPINENLNREKLLNLQLALSYIRFSSLLYRKENIKKKKLQVMWAYSRRLQIP
jgi:hypothetical protein